MQETRFTPLQFFQYHQLEIIRAENHFRQTMINCFQDFLGKILLKESEACKNDQQQWVMLQAKIEKNVDLDLSEEIKKLKEVSSDRRSQLYKKVFEIFSTNELNSLSKLLQRAYNLLEKISFDSTGWQNRYKDIDTKLREVWVYLKKSNAERLFIEKYFQNILIECFSQFLNNFSFWLSKGSYAEFHQTKKMMEIEQSLNKVVFQRKHITKKIQFSLETIIETLKDKNSKIVLWCEQLINYLQNIQKILDSADFNENCKKNCQVLCDELKEQYKGFFQDLVLISKKSIETVTLYDMKQDAFAQNYQLRPSDFCWAKYLQHKIRSLEKLLLQPHGIINDMKPKPLLVVDWLDKKDYGDLLFLLSLVSPACIEECLERKIALYQEIFEYLQKQLQELITYWGKETQSITRLYRTLVFCQGWQKTLQQALIKLGVNQINSDKNEKIGELNENIVKVEEIEETQPNTDWTTLFTLSRLFTYEKKAFFNEAFKKENAIWLFNELTQMIENKPELKDPQKALNYLNHEKQIIKTKLEKDKAVIMGKYHLWEKIITFFGLALTEQPMYKIGAIGFDIGLDSIDYVESLQPEKVNAMYNKIDEWGNRFIPTWIQERLNPERDVKIIQNLTGLFCFLADQGVSSWLGYTYRSIAAINRVLFSQFDTWVNLGAKIGCDEISLLEKESAMNWLSGLSFHLLLQNTDYWLPTFLSYTAATAASFGTGIVIDDLVKDHIEDKEWNPKVIALGKFIPQANIYSYVYSSSFKTSLEYLQSTREMTSAKALKTMGFYAEPSKQDLRKRYHELARLYHYDKCQVLCHNSKANIETIAVQNHLDKNTPNCMDTCKANEKIMQEINQAYSYLKSSINI